ATERRLVIVGQLSTGVLVVLGLAWIPMMQFISTELYKYLQSVQAYIAPPIAAVFLIGIFWKRVNAQGAIACLVTGFFLGMGRLGAELGKDHLDGVLYWYADINFLHFAIFLFLICSAVLIGVSLLGAAPADEKLAGLTFAIPGGKDPGAPPSPVWRRRDLQLTVVLGLAVAAVWIYFSGGPEPGVHKPLAVVGMRLP
ncbi:MAG: Na+/glucose cotransporter, partial [Myxococcota bacterium]